MHRTLLFIMLLAAGACAPRVNAQFDQLLDGIAGSLKQQAEQGDAEAQFQLGLRIVTGQTTDKSSKAQGAMWVQKAAKQGHVKAMHVLGALYEDGVGVEQDLKLAAEWHEKAADKGLAEAQTAMALLYSQGRGVKKDDKKAIDWAKKAADQNHAPAQALYGSMLVRGDGAPKNAAKAALWFLKAAKQDNTFAQRQLAYLYYTGAGVPVDYARCQAWYRLAAQADDPWAKNDFAWFLATCPEEKYQDGEEAVAVAKDAVRLAEAMLGEQRHEMIDTMAAALARSGKFAEAIVWQRRCVSLLADDKVLDDEEREKLKTEFNDRLKLYQAKKAYSDKPAMPEQEGEPLPNDDVLDAAKKPRTQPFEQPQPKQESEPKKKDNVT